MKNDHIRTTAVGYFRPLPAQEEDPGVTVEGLRRRRDDILSSFLESREIPELEVLGELAEINRALGEAE